MITIDITCVPADFPSFVAAAVLIIAKVTFSSIIMRPAIEPTATAILAIGCFASCDAANARATIDIATAAQIATVSSIFCIPALPALAIDAASIILVTTTSNTIIRPAIDPAAAII